MKKTYFAALCMLVAMLATATVSCQRTQKTSEESSSTSVTEDDQDFTDFLFEEEPDSVLFQESEYAVPVKSKGGEPTIADFINGILSQEETFDAYFTLEPCWNLFQKGKALPKGRSIVLDEKERYMRFDETEVLDYGATYTGIREYFCWDFADGEHQLVIENTVNCNDGKPFAGQYSGLSFYIYDIETRKMWLTSEYSVAGYVDIPDDTHLIVHQVDNKAKAIDYMCTTDHGIITKRVAWNGRRLKAIR